MDYWLVKSEPTKYGWDQLVRDGRTTWDGVRNYAARNYMKAMKAGDQVLYYHSNEGLAIVGAKVVKEHYPDPTAEGDTWSMVDLAPVKRLKRPVSLAEIKNRPELADMALLKLSRLSVTPVTRQEFELILKMSEEK